MKYDEFGFIEFSWALDNIDGFSELGPCCQNLRTLFPEQHHACQIADAAIGEIPVTSSLPVGLLDTPSGAYGALAGAPLIAGAMIMGGNDSFSYSQSVPEPSALPVLMLGLAVLAWVKKRQETSEK